MSSHVLHLQFQLHLRTTLRTLTSEKEKHLNGVESHFSKHVRNKALETFISSMNLGCALNSYTLNLHSLQRLTLHMFKQELYLESHVLQEMSYTIRLLIFIPRTSINP